MSPFPYVVYIRIFLPNVGIQVAPEPAPAQKYNGSYILKGFTVSAPPILYPQLPSVSCANDRPPKLLIISV